MFDLLQECNILTQHHYNNCDAYKNIIDTLHKNITYDQIEQIPYLPVRLFKEKDLYSIPKENIFKILNSSGTTSQTPSKIYLDKEAAELQVKILTNSMKSKLGDSRLPMIIVDSKKAIQSKPLTARGAGILGMMNYGYKPIFALNDDGSLNENIYNYTDYDNVFIFGFTFMVWDFFQRYNLKFKSAILIHSGGWKKLQDKAVDNNTFNKYLNQSNVNKIYNFYGMVEQIGSVFFDNGDGLLCTEPHSTVIIRDLKTLQPIPDGNKGIIQVISCLPKSYPGHSILTEDLGIIHNSDGYRKQFSVLGRIQKAEIRGCSDVNN